MLSGQAARPRAGKLIPQRLRFAFACERVAHNRFYQVECSSSGFAVSFYPVTKVFSKSRVEDSVTFYGSLALILLRQVPPLGAERELNEVCLFASLSL